MGMRAPCGADAEAPEEAAVRRSGETLGGRVPRAGEGAGGRDGDGSICRGAEGLYRAELPGEGMLCVNGGPGWSADQDAHPGAGS
jgi:hypothetical protein